MDWTSEDSMVGGLFFCATLTSRRGGHTPLVEAGAETSDTSVEAVKPDPGCFWEGHSGGWMPGPRLFLGGSFRGLDAGVVDENVESCRVVRPLRVPLVICPQRRTYDVVVRQTDELLCGGYKWVSQFEAPRICTRRTGEY